MPYNPNSNFGRSLMDLVAGTIPVFGNIFLVVNPSDSSDPNYAKLQEVFNQNPLNQVRVFTSTTGLADAYAATTTNNNDVIVLDAHTSHKVASMLTFANNKVHVIGFDGGGRKIGARTLISNTGAGAATDVSMIKVTGTGCTFRNIKFSNNWTVAQNLSAVLDYGSNTYFENCDIENLGSAHLTNNAAASLITAGSESIYKNTTIGQDTLLVTSTGGQQCLISKGTASHAATRMLFEKCLFQSYTSDTTHVFVRVADATSIDRYSLFDDCVGANVGSAVSSGVTLAVGVATPANMEGYLLFRNPAFLVTSKVATAAVGNTGVYVIGAIGGANTSGIAVVATT